MTITTKSRPPECDAGWSLADSALWAWFFLPVPLFLAGFLAPAAGLPLAALAIAGACWFLPRRGHALPGSSRWFPLALFAVGWTALGGAGHLVHANGIDWVPRFAVLRDLTVMPWPPRYEADTGTQLMRAPVGYYLAPALAAKAAGLAVADSLLLAWTALGTMLFLVASFGRRGGLAAAVLFAFASGLDVLGLLLQSGQLPWPTQHIEWWAGVRQYSSNTTLLFWAPNHGLPGWIAAAWLWRRRGDPDFLARLPLLMVPLMLWSPLAALGFAPLALQALWLAWQAVRPRQLLAAGTLALAPAAAIASYLLLGVGESIVAPSMPGIAASDAGRPSAALILFLAVEIGIFVPLLWRCRHPLALGAATVLLGLPWLPLGPNQDLVMRGAIPALALLWLLLAEQLTVPAEDRAADLWQGTMLVVFALGAITPLQEMHRALAGHRWLPDPTLSAPQALGGFAPHYFVREPAASWLPLRTSASLPAQQ